MNFKLSPHFSLDEFTKSQTATRYGINNQPNLEQRDNLVRLCVHVLEPLRAIVGKSISVSSGFRSRGLNSAIGGSQTSQHSLGQAADIEVYGFDNFALAKIIRDKLPFDQLILEFYDRNEGPNSGWVHVSYNANRNRKQVLTAKKVGGRTRYFPGFIV